MPHLYAQVDLNITIKLENLSQIWDVSNHVLRNLETITFTAFSILLYCTSHEVVQELFHRLFRFGDLHAYMVDMPDSSIFTGLWHIHCIPMLPGEALLNIKPVSLLKHQFKLDTCFDSNQTIEKAWLCDSLSLSEGKIIRSLDIPQQNINNKTLRHNAQYYLKNLRYVGFLLLSFTW